MGVASCSADSGRFGEGFGANSAPSSRSDVTGSIPQTTPASHIESHPLPHLASADGDGSSGGGRGMGSYQPGSGEVTGSIPAPPPPPAWTWEGGTAITVAPGETLETIARQHGVPVAAIMEANNITSPAMVHSGQHLVIPRYRPSTAGLPPAPMHVASSAPAMPAPVGPPKFALVSPPAVHVVARGETLNSIARLYGKPVMVLAKANNIRPDTQVKTGDRIVIPDVRAAAIPAPVASRAEAPAQLPTGAIASADSPHAARRVTPTEPAAEQDPVKVAEPAGSLPTFRWPVRGRIIAAFGPKPNGLQNDGINLAVPEGTPVKAAEDGVVAYAGNELKGYGNLVLVRHANGFVTAYANASDILVKRGESVKRGQVIAHSGQTGNVTSPQLHFEIRKGATPVDPAQYLNGA
jgi:murein DD-endopeptidase MepM/ murein hydrolase activator NlpD